MELNTFEYIAVAIVIANYFFLQQTILRKMYSNFMNNPFPPLHLARKRGRLQPRTLFYYETVVLKINASTFPSHFRLTRSTFESLCQFFGPRLAGSAETSVAVYPQRNIEMHLLPVLWLLATPDSYRSVADRFNLSKGTLYYYFQRVVEELYEESHRFIKWPNSNETESIKLQFYQMAKLDDCILGAVDGSYVPIPAPSDDPDVYRTRKSIFAMTLQAVCVPTLHFTDCFVGDPGSVNDRRIFVNSTFYKSVTRSKLKYFPNGEYIIGDKAYTVLDWCQAPYSRRGVLTEKQELYNFTISKTQQMIERSEKRGDTESGKLKRDEIAECLFSGKRMDRSKANKQS